MDQILLIAHVIVSICIIGLVMMQQGKGADAGAAFGGGGGGASGSLFGASGAGTFLSRATAIFAVVFFCTSLGLAFLISNKDEPTDLMDVDPAMLEQEFSDLPNIEGALPSAPEDVPGMDQSTAVEPAMESVAGEMPAVIEQVQESVVDEMSAIEETVSESMPSIEPVIEQIEESVNEEMTPALSDEIPAVSN